MSQAEMFPVDPPAPEIEHGGYMPAQVQTYRGHEMPVRYKEGYGMATLDQPTLFWLMDLVIEALTERSSSALELRSKILCAVNVSTLARHLGLMESRGLIHAEPVYYGSSSPHLGNYQGFQYSYSLPDIEVS